MLDNSRLYMIHCMSPVHVGAGQGVGVIDQPIMREKATEWPFIPGSSIKGVHREYFRQKRSNMRSDIAGASGNGEEDEWVAAAFGKSSDTADMGNAGALVMSDARILAFPVASMNGTFAYVTCPLVLKRLQRDLDVMNLKMPALDWDALKKKLDSVRQDNGAEGYVIISRGSKLTGQNDTVFLDEFESDALKDESFTQWSEWLADQVAPDDISGKLIKERTALVSDDAFQYFVTMCSEITARIRMDPERKTVENRALWYEEYLPAESILYGLIWCDFKPAGGWTERDLLNAFPAEGAYLQLGGNASVGKGRVRCVYVGRES
ncbi:CRISPR type III-B/RAMP module RAMP protein Cmr4 [Paenibacillus sp. 32O-W]|nr:CRISPR type III-B/RAMP module RAMP protein Cmr4 [Paenibacillus sp. 32O-W]